jgi:hypothetical protein
MDNSLLNAGYNIKGELVILDYGGRSYIDERLLVKD